ncbi:MAG: hypothetical protein ACFHX7_06965 [Pseudomonadota bacterium]
MRDLLREINWRDHLFALTRLVFAIVLLGLSLYYYLENQSSLKRAVSAYESQQYFNEESQVYRDLLAAYLPAYRERAARGFIGEPQRLQWVESLRAIGQRFDLPGLEFTLEGTEEVEQNVHDFWRPALTARVTDMKLTLLLSHEGDLFRLLTSLRTQANGLFSVEHCNLRWLEEFSDDVELSRLRGDCLLRWYNLDDVTAGWQGGAQ